VTRDQGILVISVTNKKVKGKTKFQIEIQPQHESLRLPLINAVDTEKFLLLVSNTNDAHLFNRDTKVIDKLQGQFNSTFISGETAYLRAASNGDIYSLTDGKTLTKCMSTGSQSGSMCVNNSQLIVISDDGVVKSYPLQ
jgi:hypothetical protein